MAISICNVLTNITQKEITPHGSNQFPVACYEDNMELIAVPLHWHDEFEFILTTEGTVTLHIGTEQITITKNSAVFINSGCLHFVKSTVQEVSVLRSLVIHPKFVGGSVESYFWQKLIVPFLRNQNLQYIILDGTQPWHQTVIQAMMKAWDAIILESYDFENDSRYFISKSFRILSDHLTTINILSVPDSNTITRMKQLLQYIDEHYAEEITNQILMVQASCSESVLLRSFKKTVGISPMRYIINYRIEKAAALLLSTNAKSCDIAIECGFNDFSYFTKIFHKIKGETPIEYRKRRL